MAATLKIIINISVWAEPPPALLRIKAWECATAPLSALILAKLFVHGCNAVVAPLALPPRLFIKAEIV